MTQRTEVVFAKRALLLLSLLLLDFVAYLLVVGPIRFERSQDVLYERAREELAAVEMPTGGAIEPGRPVAVLEVPGLGLTQVVVEGTSGALLADAPGHLRTTPLPGQPGVSVLMGRSVSFGRAFGRITELREGDEIVATTGQGRFTYRVDRVRRAGDPVPAPPAKGDGRLVLATAEGEAQWGLPLGADRAVYLDATLLDEPAAAGSGRTTALGVEEGVLKGDSSALVSLVLWAQVLLASVGLATWAALRWGRWETWLVGAPAVLATSWQVCHHAAVVLLPNLT
ncbi:MULTISPECIES: sortase domain-bontaining protein [Actinosynnema]|uniref:sortase domain-containing protein n=1 Tax=Actinosynnema TaxID=40566 RepID=UPI0020A2D05E|nr:sortase [Actinosynnema pretiosum]MCP2092316.1 LPXTG-site transpeptidase (sortase) family protein [Actinosynnema pretiosum]